jgi:hypothetical protein
MALLFQHALFSILFFSPSFFFFSLQKPREEMATAWNSDKERADAAETAEGRIVLIFIFVSSETQRHRATETRKTNRHSCGQHRNQIFKLAALVLSASFEPDSVCS